MATTYEIQAGSISAAYAVQLEKTDDAGTTGTYNASGSNAEFAWSVADGTGANQVDDLAVIRVSLGIGGTGTIDLSGTDTNVFNTAITWAKLKSIMVKADSTNGDTVTVGGGANHVIDAFEPIPAGGAAFFAAPSAGLTVTAGTGDIINFTNNDGAATAIVDVYLTGVKA